MDLLAIAENGELRSAEPLPDSLRVARDRVARDFNLGEKWLNGGPTSILMWVCQAGFLTRIFTRHYGQALAVHFAGRLDQIHFKLHAMVDQGEAGMKQTFALFIQAGMSSSRRPSGPLPRTRRPDIERCLRRH